MILLKVQTFTSQMQEQEQQYQLLTQVAMVLLLMTAQLVYLHILAHLLPKQEHTSLLFKVSSTMQPLVNSHLHPQ